MIRSNNSNNIRKKCYRVYPTFINTEELWDFVCLNELQKTSLIFDRLFTFGNINAMNCIARIQITRSAQFSLNTNSYQPYLRIENNSFRWQQFLSATLRAQNTLFSVGFVVPHTVQYKKKMLLPNLRTSEMSFFRVLNYKSHSNHFGTHGYGFSLLPIMLYESWWSYFNLQRFYTKLLLDRDAQEFRIAVLLKFFGFGWTLSFFNLAAPPRLEFFGSYFVYPFWRDSLQATNSVATSITQFFTILIPSYSWIKTSLNSVGFPNNLGAKIFFPQSKSLKISFSNFWVILVLLVIFLPGKFFVKSSYTSKNTFRVGELKDKIKSLDLLSVTRVPLSDVDEVVNSKINITNAFNKQTFAQFIWGFLFFNKNYAIRQATTFSNNIVELLKIRFNSTISNFLNHSLFGPKHYLNTILTVNPLIAFNSYTDYKTLLLKYYNYRNLRQPLVLLYLLVRFVFIVRLPTFLANLVSFMPLIYFFTIKRTSRVILNNLYSKIITSFDFLLFKSSVKSLLYRVAWQPLLYFFFFLKAVGIFNELLLHLFTDFIRWSLDFNRRVYSLLTNFFIIAIVAILFINLLPFILILIATFLFLIFFLMTAHRDIEKSAFFWTIFDSFRIFSTNFRVLKFLNAFLSTCVANFLSYLFSLIFFLLPSFITLYVVTTYRNTWLGREAAAYLVKFSNKLIPKTEFDYKFSVSRPTILSSLGFLWFVRGTLNQPDIQFKVIASISLFSHSLQIFVWLYRFLINYSFGMLGWWLTPYHKMLVVTKWSSALHINALLRGIFLSRRYAATPLILSQLPSYMFIFNRIVSLVQELVLTRLISIGFKIHEFFNHVNSFFRFGFSAALIRTLFLSDTPNNVIFQNLFRKNNVNWVVSNNINLFKIFSINSAVRGVLVQTVWSRVLIVAYVFLRVAKFSLSRLCSIFIVAFNLFGFTVKVFLVLGSLLFLIGAFFLSLLMFKELIIWSLIFLAYGFIKLFACFCITKYFNKLD